MCCAINIAAETNGAIKKYHMASHELKWFYNIVLIVLKLFPFRR